MVSNLILRFDCESTTFELVDGGSVIGGLTGVLCLSENESKSNFFKESAKLCIILSTAFWVDSRDETVAGVFLFK